MTRNLAGSKAGSKARQRFQMVCMVKGLESHIRFMARGAIMLVMLYHVMLCYVMLKSLISFPSVRIEYFSNLTPYPFLSPHV